MKYITVWGFIILSILLFIPSIPSEYSSFENFLSQDNTNKHPYIINQSTTYSEWYVCSQYSKDLIQSASLKGYTIYAVLLTKPRDCFTCSGQNGTVNTSHMFTTVKLDGRWYFVEPQTDEIIPQNKVYELYKYEYIYIGKNITIGENGASIDNRVMDEDGLILNEYRMDYLK